MKIDDVSDMNPTFAPIAFLAQSQHGPGLYAVFPAHVLQKSYYRKGMWAYLDNVHTIGSEPPQAGPTTTWPVASPPLTQTQTVFVNTGVPGLIPDKWEMVTGVVPLKIGTEILGPVVYRSAYSAPSDVWKSPPWAMASLDLAVAFVNPNRAFRSDAFHLPGQGNGFIPPGPNFPLQKDSIVRVCTEFVTGIKDISVKVEDVDPNGCIFDVLPQDGVLEPGFSGAPVVYDCGGAEPMLVGYVIHGESNLQNRTTVLRADAALQHLRTFCPALGLSIADASLASRAVWNANPNVPGQNNFYQLDGDWPS
ncbi:hypothetical protein [Ramlibacter agri]|nr:hypothetical protein [Ramlibacter agri]